MHTANTIARPHPRTPYRHGPMHRVALAIAAWRQRRALAALTPEQLKDIGLTPGAARGEAERPVWDVPRHWLG